MVKALVPRCAVCKVRESLKFCTGCNLKQYCSSEHQTQDWSHHKRECKSVKKLQTDFNRHQIALVAQPNDPTGMIPDEHWTRAYIIARFDLVQALAEISTHRSVSQALIHAMDSLRFSRMDGYGVRNLVPFLMIRLNQDQEAYDFLKWWKQVSVNDDYDWDSLASPYLNLKNENVLESAAVFCGWYPYLLFLVPITILKVKLLLEFEALKYTQELRSKLPDDIVKSLRAQLSELKDWVQLANPLYWNALYNPTGHLGIRPDKVTPRSLEEMHLVLGYSYPAWVEIEGAIDLIKSIKSI